jgi:hypothetical protein
MKMTHPEVDISPYGDQAISKPTMHQLPNIHHRSNREQIFRSGNQKSLMDNIPNQGEGRSLSGQEYSSNNYENIIDDTLQFPGDDRYMFDYEHDSARVVERPKKVSFERSFSIDDEPLPFLMEEIPAFDETVEWRELFREDELER